MPIYEYLCQNCQREAELFVQGEQQPECPQCGSKKLTKLLSVVAAPGRDAGAGALPTRPAGGCGSGCGCHPH